MVSIPKEGYTLPFKIRPRLARSLLIESGFANPLRTFHLAFPPAKASGRKGQASELPSFLQLPLSGPQIQQQMAIHSGSEHLEQVSQDKIVQDGDTRVHTTVPPTRGVDNLAGLQQRLLSYPHQSNVAKVPRVSLSKSDLQVQSASVWPVDSFYGFFHGHGADGPGQGYKDSPVPRQLADKRPNQGFLSLGHPHPPLCRELGWLVNLLKSELEPNQVFNFIGYQYNLSQGVVRPTPNKWQNLQTKIRHILAKPQCSVHQFMSLIGLLIFTEKQVPYEINYVASKEQLVYGQVP